MYLAIRQKCPLDTFFDVPHRYEPMTAKQLIKKFPKFAAIFDGQSEENTLRFYYKKSKDTGVYEFIDLDAEEEIAELMGVKIKVFKLKNEDELDEEERKGLDKDDIENFKTHMSDIRAGINWLNNQEKPMDASSESSSDSDSESDSE